MRPLHLLVTGLATGFTLIGSLLQAQSDRAKHTISVDSTFDKFRDDAPRVYFRLQRLRTSVPGLYLRLVHERCQLAIMSSQPEAGHTLILELDGAKVPALLPLARERALIGFLEYAAPGRNGTWEQLIESDVLKGKDGKTYLALAQRYVSERYLREFILDTPGISFRLSVNDSEGVEFTFPRGTQDAVREFLVATGGADVRCQRQRPASAQPYQPSPTRLLPTELQPPTPSTQRSFFSRGDVRRGCATELAEIVRQRGQPQEIGHTGDPEPSGEWSTVTLLFPGGLRRSFSLSYPEGRCISE